MNKCATRMWVKQLNWISWKHTQEQESFKIFMVNFQKETIDKLQNFNWKSIKKIIISNYKSI